jgi:hypothetical protein
MNKLVEILKNSLPKYFIEQPSTRKNISFRPFTVKEEKNLIIANQTGSSNDFLLTLTEVIDSCFDLPEKSKKLPVFDIEYFFISLRAKSIGEILQTTFVCPKTNEKINIKLNLDDIKPVFDENHKDTFTIGSKLNIKMKYPTIEYLLNTTNNDYYDMLVDCVDFIETKDELIHSREVSRDTIVEFIENLSKKDFDMLIEFFKTMPKIEKEINYKTSDGVDRSIILKGMRDFFQ